MDVAQSPPLCDRLTEPLGLGERQSLTSAALAERAGTVDFLLFLLALPFTRQKPQLGSGLLFLPPTFNLFSPLLCCPCMKSPDSEPVTSEERISGSQCSHQGIALSSFDSLGPTLP